MLQEHFATIAASFALGSPLADDAFPKLASQTQLTPLSSVNKMVQVGAHTSAWVILEPNVCLVKFTDASVFAGTSL